MISYRYSSKRSTGNSKPLDYNIRSMRADDIPKLYNLLADNQWNMELDYLMCVFSADPSGLVVVEDEHENIIGMLTCQDWWSEKVRAE